MAKENGTKRNDPILSNEYMDLHAVRQDRYDSPLKVSIIQHSRKMMDPRAQFAAACIERWGMVAAAPDGEDSAGRQQARVMEPSEIVERACAVADEAYASFEKRGWLIAAPSINDMLDAIKDHENAND